jgi:hypothetical protein
MDTELKVRTEKVHVNPQNGYQAYTQRMVYEQPHQLQVLSPVTQQPVLQQPMIQQQSTGVQA